MADTILNDHLANLLSQCGLGNRKAFAELYDSTKSKLFAVSLRIVRERHIAEEVLQDSFVNIWNNAAKYATAKSAPMTWMTAIVREARSARMDALWFFSAWMTCAPICLSWK